MNILPLPICEQLQPFIDRALYIKHKGDYSINFKLVPRFYGAFFFTLDYMGIMHQKFNHSIHHTVQSCNIYFGGVGYVPIDFELPNTMELILVLPKPHCTALFWKEDAHCFANNMSQVSDASQKLRILNDRINSTQLLANKWLYIQQYLKNQITNLPNNIRYVTKAIDIIFGNNGIINVETLASQSYTCDKNLRDSFQRHVGFSPKKFASIVRFNALIDRHLKQRKTLLESCTALHYYDLSHLNKDFMRFTGVNAETFFAQEQGINGLILTRIR